MRLRNDINTILKILPDAKKKAADIRKEMNLKDFSIKR
jgi:hypothetical protein